MNQQIIETLKGFVMENDVKGVQREYGKLLQVDWLAEFGYLPNKEHIFQQVYLFAASKRRRAIMNWMRKEVLEKMDMVSQAALKPSLTYAKYVKGR